MLDRIARGSIPPKHHIAHRSDDGKLYREQCLTRKGFDGAYTISYHANRPQTQRPVDLRHGFRLPRETDPRPLRKRHYLSGDLKAQHAGGPPIDGRVPLVFNDDVTISVSYPDADDPVYFVNGDADDLIYIFEGGGTLRSIFGDVRFEKDDYVFVPKGVLHRFIVDGPQYWLHVEGVSMGLLDQWRNETGQLRMDAPYCHRDFRRPTFASPRDEGIREVVVKRALGEGANFHGFRYDHSPLDVVGFDGTVYPWAFPILNFQPRAGLVHLPPDWHGTFKARGALICSFVPRAVDFHPDSIPCPYPHSSVDCDEILFYCRGNFTSRKGVGPGSVSHHPMGIAHGPHPGSYEASIGHRETTELAVMLDTFKALKPTPEALGVEDMAYHESFA